MLRKLLATSFFALVVSASASQDFSGTYCLDLQASDNYEPLMAQMGVSYLMRKVAAFIQLQATYTQKGDTLSTRTTGPGFALHETMHMNGQSELSSENCLGATSYILKAVGQVTNWLQSTRSRCLAVKLRA